MSDAERKTVLLLGAGASRGSTFQLPMMVGFFDEQIGDEQLEKFLRWFYNDTPRDKYNLEEVLSYLELARTRLAQWGYTHRSKFNPQTLYDATLRYVKGRLELPSGSAICDYHLTLCKRLAAQDTIITFNYDLITDQALFSLEARDTTDGRYAPDGTRMGKLKSLVSSNSFWGGPPITLTTPERQSGFYLKLHGSLHWLHCPTPDCRNNQSIHSLEFGRDNYSQEKGGPCRFCGAEIQAFLVAPMPSKQLQDKGRLRILWKLALQELAEADRVVVVGLSFAPSDFELRWLVKQAMELRKRSAPLDLHLVEPQIAHQKRVSEIFGIKPTFHEQFLNTYLAHFSSQ